MVAIPHIAMPDPTLEAADAALRAIENARAPRDYVGLSSLGDACSRRVYYNFHDPISEQHDALTLKRFADGHASEAVIIRRLRLVPGLTLIDIDPDTGRQIAVSDFEGKLRGHLDGVVLGLLQAPTTWHAFEAKCSGEKTFNKLVKLKAEHGEKNALRLWNETYHIQAQGYLGYLGLKRHWLVCCTPGARDWTSVRTEFDPEVFAALKDKADRIIHARAPLAKVGNSADWWQCKSCQYSKRCHGSV